MGLSQHQHAAHVRGLLNCESSRLNYPIEMLRRGGNVGHARQECHLRVLDRRSCSF